MRTVHGGLHDALISAGAEETRTREAAGPVAEHDDDIGDIETSPTDIKASLRIIQCMSGSTLAFVVASTRRGLR